MAFDGTLHATQPLDLPQVLDARAFGRLWRQQRSRLMGLALRMTGHPTDAEDVVQEAFLQAWRGRERFAGQSQASTWLYRIAANAALMHLRSRRRRPVELCSFLEGDDGGVADLATDAPGPERLALSAERRDAVRGAVARLPARDRALLEAILADRLADTADTVDTDPATDPATRDDVASAFGSASARKSRLARARTRLRCDDQLAAVI